jgi:hypothetical protein
VTCTNEACAWDQVVQEQAQGKGAWRGYDHGNGARRAAVKTEDEGPGQSFTYIIGFPHSLASSRQAYRQALAKRREQGESRVDGRVKSSLIASVASVVVLRQSPLR